MPLRAPVAGGTLLERDGVGLEGPTVKEIQLTRGAVALVDDDDFERLGKFKWFLGAKGYAMGRMGASWKTAPVYLHRIVTNAPDGVPVDHADRNKMNCTKSNLRLCDGSRNAANRIKTRSTRGGSRFKGAYRDVRRGRNRWTAEISVNGESIKLGTFDTDEECAHAYDAAAREHFGEFACLNFPEKRKSVKYVLREHASIIDVIENEGTEYERRDTIECSCQQDAEDIIDAFQSCGCETARERDKKFKPGRNF